MQISITKHKLDIVCDRIITLHREGKSDIVFVIIETINNLFLEKTEEEYIIDLSRNGRDEKIYKKLLDAGKIISPFEILGYVRANNYTHTHVIEEPEEEEEEVYEY